MDISQLRFLPCSHCAEALDVLELVIQFEGIRVRDCATRLEVRPRDDLLDGDFNLLPINGVLYTISRV